MKIPHTIPQVILRAYTHPKTPEELEKRYEGRVLRSEDANWDNGLFEIGYVKPLSEQALNLIIEDYPFYVKLTDEWNHLGEIAYEKARDQWQIDVVDYKQRKASYDRKMLDYDALMAKITTTTNLEELANASPADSDSDNSDDDVQQFIKLRDRIEPTYVPDEFPEYQPIPAVLDRLIPTDRMRVIEEIDFEQIPLDIAVKTIPDEYYWERACNDRWPDLDPDDHGDSWRRMYLEKHTREAIENFHPAEGELPPLIETVELCSKSVLSLTLNNLIPECWGVPRKPIIQPIFEGDEPPELGSNFEFTPEDEGFEESAFMKEFWVKNKERREKLEAARRLIWANGEQWGGLTDDEILKKAEEFGEVIEVKPRTNSHVDLSLLVPKLTHLKQLSIIYEMAEIAGDWEERFCEFTVEDCEILAKALAESPTIEIFELNRSRVNGEQTKVLVRDGLLKMQHLKVLNLNYNKLCASGALAIARLITDETSRVRHTLHTLKIARCNIKSKGCKAIAYALTLNRYLTILDMRLNHIGNSGAKDLGHALAVNTSLQLLNIAANEFSDPACYVLGKMLYHNSTLKELDLSSNNLGIKGGEAIALALRVNKTILKLDVRLANTSLEFEYDIESHVKKNRARVNYNLLEREDIVVPTEEAEEEVEEEETEDDEDEEEETEILFRNKDGSDDSDQEIDNDFKRTQSQEELDEEEEGLGEGEAEEGKESDEEAEMADAEDNYY